MGTKEDDMGYHGISNQPDEIDQLKLMVMAGDNPHWLPFVGDKKPSHQLGQSSTGEFGKPVAKELDARSILIYNNPIQSQLSTNVHHIYFCAI